jgi:hypothetical protein
MAHLQSRNLVIPKKYMFTATVLAGVCHEKYLYGAWILSLAG